MLKNSQVLEIIKNETKKYQMHLPDQADATEVLQVLQEMFNFVSNLIQENMKKQVAPKVEDKPKEGENGQ